MRGCRVPSSLADSVACAVGVAASIHTRIFAFLAVVVAAAAAAAAAGAGAGAVIPTRTERGVAADRGLCLGLACWRYGTREAIEEFELRGGGGGGDARGAGLGMPHVAPSAQHDRCRHRHYRLFNSNKLMANA